MLFGLVHSNLGASWFQFKFAIVSIRLSVANLFVVFCSLFSFQSCNLWFCLVLYLFSIILVAHACWVARMRERVLPRPGSVRFQSSRPSAPRPRLFFHSLALFWNGFHFILEVEFCFSLSLSPVLIGGFHWVVAGLLRWLNILFSWSSVAKRRLDQCASEPSTNQFACQTCVPGCTQINWLVNNSSVWPLHSGPHESARRWPLRTRPRHSPSPNPCKLVQHSGAIQFECTIASPFVQSIDSCSAMPAMKRRRKRRIQSEIMF